MGKDCKSAVANKKIYTFAKKCNYSNMRFFKNPNTTIAILAIYTAIVYIYFFPKNNEMSTTEKWVTVGTSCIVLSILWYLLRRRDKLRREREKDLKNNRKE